MTLHVNELTGDMLEKIVKYCNSHFSEHAAAYFIIATLCDGYLDEYGGQAVTISRFNEVNGLRGAIQDTLNSPDNITVLNKLLLEAEKIGDWNPSSHS